MSSLNQMISKLNENITLMVGGRELEDFKTNETAVEQVKLRRYEQPQNWKKIAHLFWQNSCFYSVVSKQMGDFFQTFVAFSEKLNFMLQAPPRRLHNQIH